MATEENEHDYCLLKRVVPLVLFGAITAGVLGIWGILALALIAGSIFLYKRKWKHLEKETSDGDDTDRDT